MDKNKVVAGAVGLSLLVTVPKMAAPAPVDRSAGGTEVVAAQDIFLDIKPVKGEARRPGVRARRTC